LKYRPATLAVLFAAAFLVVLLVHLPLRWSLPLLPKALQCQGAEGSLWSGRCAQLAWSAAGSGMLLGDVSWSMRPLRLLRTRLAFDVRIQRGGGQASGLVQLGLGRIELLELAARGPLDPALIKGFPPGWSGEIEVSDARVRLEQGKLAAVDGTVVARNLVARTPRPTGWGSYQLHIPRLSSGGLAPGELKDLDGPLQLKGTLKIAPDFSWQLDGGVATRPGADPGLAQQIQFLGAPDAQGLRPFSLAGS
jgi:general secretion pathway protein N